MSHHLPCVRDGHHSKYAMFSVLFLVLVVVHCLATMFCHVFFSNRNRIFNNQVLILGYISGKIISRIVRNVRNCRIPTDAQACFMHYNKYMMTPGVDEHVSVSFHMQRQVIKSQWDSKYPLYLLAWYILPNSFCQRSQLCHFVWNKMDLLISMLFTSVWTE